MSHILRQQHLQERLSVLEDMVRSSDSPGTMMVCSSCYSLLDPVGCLCDRKQWTLLSVVILQIKLDLTSLHVEQHPSI